MLKIYGLRGTNRVKKTEEENNLCSKSSMKRKKKPVICRTSEVVVGSTGVLPDFDVLLTVHLSIILIIYQLNAQILVL